MKLFVILCSLLLILPSFSLWHINWFISAQSCNLRNQVKFHVKNLLQWMGDRCFRDCKKVLCLLCCFWQVVFERFCFTDDICTFSLNVGAPRWRLRTWWCRERLRKVPVNSRNWIWIVSQRVECKRFAWTETFGPGLIRFRNTLNWTEPLSFTQTLCVIINHSLEEKLSTQPLRLASIPPALFSRPLCCYPANRTADPALTSLLDLFCFN